VLSRRVPQDLTPNPWSAALEARRAAGLEVLDLADWNPVRAGLSPPEPEVLAALAAPGAGDHRPDPLGAPDARAAVAASETALGRPLAVDDVVLTSGTSESYAHLFRLLVNPGGGVAAPVPCYPLFEPIARAEGVEVVPYRIVWVGRWEVDLASLEAALARGARAALVVQPHVPLGSCLAPDEIAAVEDLCLRHGAALVSDEVFVDFPWPPRPAGLPSLLHGVRRAPTFVLGGLSKACGLPQMKLGWIALAGPAAARAEARRGLAWLADLFLSVGGPVQAALPRLLAGRAAFRARAVARVAENLAALGAALAGAPSLTLREAEGGWAAVLRAPGDDDEAWALALLARGVAVHPGHFYDLDGAHLVLSLIAPPAAFAEGARRLAALAAEDGAARP